MNLNEEIKLQIAQLNKWTKLYDEGHPEVSDKTWDEAYFKLKELEDKIGIIYPDSPTQKISYEIVSQLNKVKHNHSMLSLAKTKDWNEFLRYFKDKDVIGMPKMDGLTCSLRYINGKLVSAETRGNGEIGEDILHNAKVISSIPKKINYKDELIVDGEIICKYIDFISFEDEYANPRNFASGSIRLLDSKECAKRNLTFIAWNIIKGFDDDNSFLSKLNKIYKLGFKVVPYSSSLGWDEKEFLIKRAKELSYPIDGLVGRFDDIKYGNGLGVTGHHARSAYAFKFYDDEYETELIDIDWTMGRTGVLTPVAIFKEVDDGESITTRASLHNLSVMYDILGTPYIKQKIWIAKMNQIIPQITKAEKTISLDVKRLNIPKICPICGEPTEIIESEMGVKNLFCSNPQCSGKLINRLDHFCGKKGLDIKGLSKATLEKLIDWGWITNNVEIYNLTAFEREWKIKPGFGEKSVSNILSAIESSKNCELWRFISALGIPLIGSTVAKDLARIFGTWENFINAVDNDYKFYELPNFGYEMHKAIHSFCYAEADELASFMNIFPCENNNTTTSLKDISVVVTGKLNIYKNRDELKAAIEAAGGKVVGSVSSKTNYLINNDKESTSAKNKKAKELNIPILSEEEFIKQFLQ